MAPRLFSCLGREAALSSSAAASRESNETVDLTVEEQRRMGPVLVELFSSQGCATSPEAEAVVARLAQGVLRGPEEEVPPVVVLDFHVEYWDYMGWKDPFGSSIWTVRQKAYVESLKLDTLYTPQVVVHGRSQCLGTDQDAIISAVRSATRCPSPTMQASFTKPSPDTLQVSLTGALRTKVDGRGADVLVALYENGLVTDCTRGENKGKALANDHVVRRMEKLLSVKNTSAKKNLSGSVQFHLWEDFNPAKCGLVLFVQNASLHTFGVQHFQIPDTV